jgi:hypothetical protein
VIVGISGHQSLEPTSTRWLEKALDTELTQLPISVGVSSLAAGTDQLFAGAVLEHGWRLSVVIPCHQYERTFSNPDDKQQFWELYGRATERTTLDFAEPSEDAFLAAGKRIVDMSDLMLFVWNGLPAGGRGGTADIVEYATVTAIPFVHLNPVNRTATRSPH